MFVRCLNEEGWKSMSFSSQLMGTGAMCHLTVGGNADSTYFTLQTKSQMQVGVGELFGQFERDLCVFEGNFKPKLKCV